MYPVSAMESDFGLSCPCGLENFERVLVRRAGQGDYVTDFVACVLCRVMFHLPDRPLPVDPTLERDAAIAAKLYPQAWSALVINRSDSRCQERRAAQACHAGAHAGGVVEVAPA